MLPTQFMPLCTVHWWVEARASRPCQLGACSMTDCSVTYSQAQNAPLGIPGRQSGPQADPELRAEQAPLIAHLACDCAPCSVQPPATARSAPPQTSLPQPAASSFRPAMPPNMAEQMRGFAEQMRANPAMAGQMQSMMQNMDPQQFKMMVSSV